MKIINNFYFVFFLLIPFMGYSQTTVEGVVKDSTDFPLTGVEVTNQDTDIKETTDFEGKFEISADEGDLLQFKMEGYDTQSVKYSGQASINIVMNRSKQFLDKVVIVGYGTTTHKDATGSVASVTSEDFNNGDRTSPEKLLTGKVPGLQVNSGGAPGSGSTIRIRGGSSLNASNDPLFVVDGVPLDNGTGVSGTANPLNSINPSDIESISVLKDASATAIYGSRASNGVIMITTKKGKNNQELKFDFNYTMSVHDRIKQTDVLSSDQFRDVMNERAADNVSDLLTNEDTNWQDEIFRTAIAHDADLSASGVIGGFLPFRASVGYTNEDGILKTGNFERTTGSINLSPSFFDDHLDIEANVKGSYEENQFPNEGAIGSAMRMDPTKPVYSDNDDYGGYWEWLSSSGNPNTNATQNPVALLDLRDNHSYVKRSIGNLKFDYNFHFLPELKAVLNLGYDYSEGKGSETVPPFARSEFNADNPDDGGLKSSYKEIKRNTLLDFYFNYNKDFDGLKSSVDFTAGYSYQKFAVDEHSISQNYEQTTTDYDKRSPYDRLLIGFFGRLNYTFNDKYLLTATLRRDGTSRFSKDDRWGWFPSVSLAWDLAEESFLEESDAVNSLKLRLSWGVTGQENLGDNPYPYKPIYESSINHLAHYPIGDNYVSTLRPNIYDPHIKWEEQTTWNIGLDYGFFDDRLHGAIDFYKKKTKDMIQSIAAPLPNLNNEIETNVGSMENKGVELEIGGDIIKNDNLTWSAKANATYNENKITKISGTSNSEFYQVGGISGGTGNTIQVNQVGHSAQSFYVYEQLYNTDKNPIEDAYVDQNDDGKINEKDLRVYHSGRPKWTLGLSSDLNYKNWDFSFSMRANLGNYMYNNVASDVGTFASTRGTNGFLANIQSDALNSEFENNRYFTDYYIQNASFLKMDYITLGYTFNDLFKDINLRLFTTVENAFTITDYDGLDPEISGGIDNNFYPRSRIYSIGINLNF